ncbi:MAG: hypothetical protein Aureis2KO_28740 [Aureisphaera sp.]
MRLLRLVFDFYINASIHVALAVTSLGYVTLLEFDVTPLFLLIGVIFFGAISGYNFIKYARIAGLHHRSLASSLKAIQVFSLLSAGALLAILFFVPADLLSPLSVLGFLTLLYAVPFFRKKSLRTLNGLKIFVVAGVWAGVSVLIPLWNTDLLGQMDVWLSFFQLFFLVIVWTLPFEIRDISYDAPSLGTLPQKFGIRGVKVLGFSLVLAVILAEGFKDEINYAHFTGLVLVGVLSAYLLGISKKKQSKYFASFLVESIPIVWCMLTLAFERLLG